jgi:hypothetical protein
MVESACSIRSSRALSVGPESMRREPFGDSRTLVVAWPRNEVSAERLRCGSRVAPAVGEVCDDTTGDPAR